MKKIFLLFTLISSFAYSQMPNISKVWLNDGIPYTGTIGNGNDKEILKMKFESSEQNKKDDQEYFISGTSTVQSFSSNFEGTLKVTKYRDGTKTSIFGEYLFSEEMKGKHSGIFKGKFVYTFKWNKKTEKIEDQHIEFTGDWKSYDGTLTYKTNFKN